MGSMTANSTTTAISQQDKALLFRSLHTPAAPLRLANVWDAVGARLVQQTGARAIATTSAGVAWGLGSADGDLLGRDQALELIARVAAAVEVPVTADIESGFGATAADVAETVTGVIAAGAVGVNLEDAVYSGEFPLRPVAEQAERIAAARAAADATGVPLYLNARIDTYLQEAGAPETRLQDTLARAAAYIAAGADGIFVPGVSDPAVIAGLAEVITAPLNISGRPGLPSFAELGRLGVARVSLGATVAAAAYAVVRQAARELAEDGTYTSLEGALPYGDLNELMR